MVISVGLHEKVEVSAVDGVVVFANLPKPKYINSPERSALACCRRRRIINAYLINYVQRTFCFVDGNKWLA